MNPLKLVKCNNNSGNAIPAIIANSVHEGDGLGTDTIAGSDTNTNTSTDEAVPPRFRCTGTGAFCMICMKSFASDSARQEHHRRMHLLKKTVYQCHTCTSQFLPFRTNEIRKHIEDYHLGYKPAVPYVVNLKKHVKPYNHLNRCEQCTWAHSSVQNLNFHVFNNRHITRCSRSQANTARETTTAPAPAPVNVNKQSGKRVNDSIAEFEPKKPRIEQSCQKPYWLSSGENHTLVLLSTIDDRAFRDLFITGEPILLSSIAPPSHGPVKKEIKVVHDNVVLEPETGSSNDDNLIDLFSEITPTVKDSNINIPMETDVNNNTCITKSAEEEEKEFLKILMP